MPARKSISDKDKCREALPMLSEAVARTQFAKANARHSWTNWVVAHIDQAIEQLQLAKKVLQE